MRVLFSSRPALGHFHPMVPLARAVADAGHEVAFATGDPFGTTVREAGFACFSAGLSVDRWRAEFAARFGDFDRIPRTEFRSLFFGRVFTDLEVPARASDLTAIIDHWRPELVVHGIAEFAGPLAATLAGIPYATVGFGPLPQPQIARLADDAVRRHWQAAGLDPDEGRLYRSLYLDPCPPALQVSGVAQLRHTQQVRPESADRTAGEAPPAAIEQLPARPTVYLTLGTIFNHDQATFTTVLRGLAGEPVNVIATVGRDIDPEALGPQGDNVLVFRYVPQARVLSRCDLVICHGGGGTLFGALSFGLPVLLLPRGADNFYNAERALAAGAGRRLLDAELIPEAVAREVARLRGDVRYREAAARIAAEIAEMPAPAAVVGALEDWARRGARGPVTAV